MIEFFIGCILIVAGGFHISYLMLNNFYCVNWIKYEWKINSTTKKKIHFYMIFCVENYANNWKNKGILNKIPHVDGWMVIAKWKQF